MNTPQRHKKKPEMKPTNAKLTIPLRNGQAARQVERERKAGWDLDFARPITGT